jgi:hydrogenase nickel incorporation protein HypA/HybF
MHEYPVTQRIIAAVLDTAAQAKARRILKITLVVGEHSGFIGESIQMYFDILSKDTPAEGAKLLIKPVTSKLFCSNCRRYFSRKKGSWSFACPQCGKDGTLSDKGNEFYIKDIEIED